MRWVKAVLGSSLGRETKPKVRPPASPGERRRMPAPDAPAAAMDELRSELCAILALHTDERAPHALRHLVAVYDELGCSGWAGVEAFPLRVLARARVQAEMLATLEHSTIFATFVERLRLVEVASRLREEDELAPKPEAPVEFPDSEVEVTQGSSEEYEILERSWVGTVPAGLDRPPGRNEPPPASRF
jgi:hypothetical protein